MYVFFGDKGTTGSFLQEGSVLVFISSSVNYVRSKVAQKMKLPAITSVAVLMLMCWDKTNRQGGIRLEEYILPLFSHLACTVA